MNNFRYIDHVATLKLDVQACVGCALCEVVCPHGVLQVNEKKTAIVDFDACMECGACVTNCPTHALTVSPGVGCAAYIIETWLKKGKNKGTSCC